MAADSGKAANSVQAAAGAAYLAIFAGFFGLYALTASPAMGWLDSPEFVAQSLSLGVAHSPGHPLVGLLGYLASLIPVGDLVWRVNLMSSLCAAGAVALFSACLHLVVLRFAPRVAPRTALIMALSVAAVTGASWALWSNAVRAEVYALQALLSVGALFALLRYDSEEKARDLLLAAFFLALGLANHHLLAIEILLPAAVLVLWRRKRPSLRIATITGGVGLLGLSALVYLPIRSLAHPLVNFGAPHTFERFVWTLRGAAFSKSIDGEHASTPLVDALQILAALVDAVSLPLFCLALFGFVVGVTLTRERGMTLFLAAMIALSLGARVMLGFDPETPDHHAYLLPAMFALWLLAIAGIAKLCAMALSATRPLPKAPAISALALALLVPIQVASQWPRSSQATSWASDDLAHWAVRDVPPGSLLLIAYFQTGFRLWALQAVEGSRPDLTILDRSFLTYPGMAEQAKFHHPELAALIDSPLRAGQQSPVAMLRELAAQRPIYAELHPNVDQTLGAALRPHGAFAQLVDEGEPTRAEHDQQASLALDQLMARAGRGEREEARAALLWHDATRMDQYCVLGARSAAASVYAHALRLAPDDLMLDAMASACGLTKP